MLLLTALLLFQYHLIPTSCDEGPTVQTHLGSILGTTETSRLGIKFYSFRGIRYAKAPVGKLRFKPPVPEEGWTGIMNATVDGLDCYPAYYKNESDCLNLNVYTRRINNEKEQRPVLVFINRDFNVATSASDIFGPDFLMDHDIVLVTFNYRLGTFGFFSTGDKHGPGNYGMKDQVEALKWVKNNIHYFGGDPNKVTIAGKNAGGASVGLHLVSPMSRGLFHGAIMLSGSATNPWVINKHPMRTAYKEAKILNCPTDDSEKMMDCMSKIPVDNVMNANYELKGPTSGGWTHSPVIEPENDGQERFLDKDPLISLMEGNIADVPILIGTARYEQINRALSLAKIFMRLEEKATRNLTQIIPEICQYEQSDTINNKVREFYFGKADKPITFESVDNLTDLLTDACVIYGVVQSAKLISAKNTKPVYLSQYNYLAPGLQAVLKAGQPRDKVANTQELYYIFHPKMYPVNFDAKTKDGQYVTKITTLWKNFVETGNPTPEPSTVLDNVMWERFSKEDPKYLNINETLKLENGLYFGKRIAFWESLFPLPEHQ